MGARFRELEELTIEFSALDDMEGSLAFLQQSAPRLTRLASLEITAVGQTMVPGKSGRSTGRSTGRSNNDRAGHMLPRGIFTDWPLGVIGVTIRCRCHCNTIVGFPFFAVSATTGLVICAPLPSVLRADTMLPLALLPLLFYFALVLLLLLMLLRRCCRGRSGWNCWSACTSVCRNCDDWTCRACTCMAHPCWSSSTASRIWTSSLS